MPALYHTMENRHKYSSVSCCHESDLLDTPSADVKVADSGVNAEALTVDSGSTWKYLKLTKPRPDDMNLQEEGKTKEKSGTKREQEQGCVTKLIMLSVNNDIMKKSM